MPLNELQCRNAKPLAKTCRLFDRDGLYLEVSPKGGKYWRMKYRFGGKEKRLAIGVYPLLSLSDARDRCMDARKQVAKGIDPSAVKQAVKLSQAGADSFEVIAREWHAKNLHMWTPKHGEAILTRLAQNVFPWLGKKPINQITPPELLAVLRRMESRGAIETTHRVRASCGQICRYAIATGRLERDFAADLRGAIPPVKATHFASITDPVGIGALLRAVDAYEGGFITKCALQLAPLVFVRPGELRHAEWAELDMDKAEWRIPAGKMKARVQHIVPLSRQAIEIIEALRPLTGHGAAAKYLFPSVRTLQRPMSDNTLISALRRMGYTTEQMTPHGFRSTASTLLNERGYNRDWIERQLAHGERDNVRAAYNYAQHLPERAKMMQEWADYLDELKVGGKVLAFRKG